MIQLFFKTLVQVSPTPGPQPAASQWPSQDRAAETVLLTPARTPPHAHQHIQVHRSPTHAHERTPLTRQTHQRMLASAPCPPASAPVHVTECTTPTHVPRPPPRRIPLPPYTRI